MAKKKKTRYEYKVTLGRDAKGEAIRKSFYSTKSKADAKRKAEEYIERTTVQTLFGKTECASRKFKTYAMPCLEAYKKPYVKGNTYYGTYRPPVVNRLIPWFGEMQLNEIRPFHVVEYINAIKGKYKAETVKKDFTILSFIMQCAVDDGFCERNPCQAKSIKLPKIGRPEKNVWSQSEYDTAYAYARSYPNGLDIMLLMETGITRSELLGLHADDLDFENKTIRIQQGLVTYHDLDGGKWVTENENLKNDYRFRDIPITDAELLNRLKLKAEEAEKIAAQQPPAFLFFSPMGGAYDPDNWNKRVFRRFMRDVHTAHPEVKELTAHELRHTRATLWERQGVPINVVFHLLGHKNTRMFEEVYSHPETEYYRSELLRVKDRSETRPDENISYTEKTAP